MLYRQEYLSFNFWLPNQTFSQNLICSPLWTRNLPLDKNWSLMSISPDQKWESPGFFVTWDNVLFFKYFRLINFCHIPSSFNSLNNHLLSKHTFCALLSYIYFTLCCEVKQLFFDVVTLENNVLWLHAMSLFMLISKSASFFLQKRSFANYYWQHVKRDVNTPYKIFCSFTIGLRDTLLCRFVNAFCGSVLYSSQYCAHHNQQLSGGLLTRRCLLMYCISGKVFVL